MIGKDFSFPHVDREDSEAQVDLDFAGHRCHFVDLVVRRLRYSKMNVINMLNISSFPYSLFSVGLEEYSIALSKSILLDV